MEDTRLDFNEDKHLGYEIGSKAIVGQELADLAKITDPELRTFALGNIYTSIEHSDTYRYEFEKQASPEVKNEYANYVAAPAPTVSMTQKEAVAQAMEFRAITGTADFCMTAPTGAIGRPEARQMVEGDIKSLEKITDPRLRDLALNNIGQAAFAQESYSRELHLQAPGVALEMEPPLHEALNVKQSSMDKANGSPDMEMQSVDTSPQPATPDQDYGLSLLTKAHDLQQELASTKAQWNAHVDARSTPVAGVATQIDPMQDKHIAAQYEPAPSARFPSVEAARSAQEKEVAQAQHLKPAQVAAPDPQAGTALTEAEFNAFFAASLAGQAAKAAPAPPVQNATAPQAASPAASYKPIGKPVATPPAAKSSVRYKSADSQQQASQYTRPQLGKKKEEVKKPKNLALENTGANPYAVGRHARPTKTRIAAAVLTHMAFGIAGGYLVRHAIGAMSRKANKPASPTPQAKKATPADKATNDMTVRPPAPKSAAKPRPMRP